MQEGEVEEQAAMMNERNEALADGVSAGCGEWQPRFESGHFF